MTEKFWWIYYVAFNVLAASTFTAILHLMSDNDGSVIVTFASLFAMFGLGATWGSAYVGAIAEGRVKK